MTDAQQPVTLEGAMAHATAYATAVSARDLSSIKGQKFYDLPDNRAVVQAEEQAQAFRAYLAPVFARAKQAEGYRQALEEAWKSGCELGTDEPCWIKFTNPEYYCASCIARATLEEGAKNE